MSTVRTVVCMKWGTLYSPEYVNVLYRACRANITGDFRFVCLTDDRTGLLPEVDVFPIPDIGLDTWHYFNGAPAPARGQWARGSATAGAASAVRSRVG